MITRFIPVLAAIAMLLGNTVHAQELWNRTTATAIGIGELQESVNVSSRFEFAAPRLPALDTIETDSHQLVEPVGPTEQQRRRVPRNGETLRHRDVAHRRSSGRGSSRANSHETATPSR